MTDKLVSSIPTPLTPPKLEEDRLSWLRLFRSRRVGATTFWRLIDEYGTAAAALDALPEVARAAGADDYIPCLPDEARREIRAGQKAGARLICRFDPEYPSILAEIADAPPLLWAVGDLSLLQRPAVALVGARNASSLGERMASGLARALGDAGLVVISGLARGIDAAAHEAALPTGTIAVLAGGVDICYPQENRKIFDEIGRIGLRLSEQPAGLEPQARHFPPRNRLVSGLSLGLVVVEAAARSGSLITARNALDQGREVMAVPGHPFDARAAGCNLLIRDGARLVRGGEDVLEALGPAALPERRVAANWREQARLHEAALADIPERPGRRRAAANGQHSPAPRGSRSLAETTALHQKILSRIGTAAVAEDQLIRDLALPAQDVAPVLLSLELEGRIARQAGGLIARTV